METLLSINGLYFSYDGREDTLEGIFLSISKGEIVGIAGPNGAGKTTLLKLIVGLLKPTRGSIKILESSEEDTKKQRISYLPQNLQKIDSNFPATVREVVSTGLYGKLGIFGRLNREDKEAIEKAISNVGMARHANSQITNLSGGQLQRALIARSLVSNPSLLILDEPTAAVDISGEEEFYNLIKHLNDTYGVAVLLVSHDVYSLVEHTNRFIFINKKILYDGEPGKLTSSKLIRLLFSHKHSRKLVKVIEAAKRKDDKSG